MESALENNHSIGRKKNIHHCKIDAFELFYFDFIFIVIEECMFYSNVRTRYCKSYCQSLDNKQNQRNRKFLFFLPFLNFYILKTLKQK